MDYIDSGLKIAETMLPSALRYFGQAKEREEMLTQTQGDLAQARAENEVLVLKTHELRQAQKITEKKNRELAQSNTNLEAFRNIVLLLLMIAAVTYVGMRAAQA